MSAPDLSTSVSRFADLSPARKRLVEIFRELQFCRFESLPIAEGEPQLDDPPTIVRLIKLPIEAETPAEAESPAEIPGDFALKKPTLDLFKQFDRYQSGVVRRLECRFGQPCLVEFVITGPRVVNPSGRQPKSGCL